MIVDLGCGPYKRGDIGIDIVPPPVSSADIVCNLGLEPIPLDDNSADKVVAYDFIEHVPPYVYYKESGKWQVEYPVITLFNEVYRILKPDGVFEIFSPVYPKREVWQDPTHKSVWTEASLQYFATPNLMYGIQTHFELVEQGLVDHTSPGSHLKAILKKKGKG